MTDHLRDNKKYFFNSDPNETPPDIYGLYQFYDNYFFNDILQSAELKWSKRMTQCAGTTTLDVKIQSQIQSILQKQGHVIISLSEPILKYRKANEVKETLLHEMIHGYLFLTNPKACRDGGHGIEFQEVMKNINAITNLNITVYHDFYEEVDASRVHVWQCDGICRNQPPYYGICKRSMNRPPQKSDKWFDNHQRQCGGTYVKIQGPDLNKADKKQLKVKDKDMEKENKKQKKPDKSKINSDQNSLDKMWNIEKKEENSQNLAKTFPKLINKDLKVVITVKIDFKSKNNSKNDKIINTTVNLNKNFTIDEIWGVLCMIDYKEDLKINWFNTYLYFQGQKDQLLKMEPIIDNKENLGKVFCKDNFSLSTFKKIYLNYQMKKKFQQYSKFDQISVNFDKFQIIDQNTKNPHIRDALEVPQIFGFDDEADKSFNNIMIQKKTIQQKFDQFYKPHSIIKDEKSSQMSSKQHDFDYLKPPVPMQEQKNKQQQVDDIFSEDLNWVNDIVERESAKKWSQDHQQMKNMEWNSFIGDFIEVEEDNQLEVDPFLYESLVQSQNEFKSNQSVLNPEQQPQIAKSIQNSDQKHMLNQDLQYFQLEQEYEIEKKQIEAKNEQKENSEMQEMIYKSLIQQKIDELNLSSEPADSAQTITFGFRLPNGSRIIRKFRKCERIEQLFQFVLKKQFDGVNQQNVDKQIDFESYKNRRKSEICGKKSENLQKIQIDDIFLNLYPFDIMRSYPAQSLRGLENKTIQDVFSDSEQELLNIGDL